MIMNWRSIKRGLLQHSLIAVMVGGAMLVAGCAVLNPAPVSERTPPPKPGAKPAVPPTAALPSDPAAAPKPESVVVKPLPPASPTGPATPTAPTHTVRQGDTLFSIAKANAVEVRDLAAWNNIADPTSIRLGQVLRLTPPDGSAAVQVKPLDGGAPPSDPNLKTQPLAQRVPYSDEAYARLAKSASAAKLEVKPEVKPDVKPETKPEVAAESKPDAKPATPRADGEVDWSWPTSGKVIGNFSDGSSKGVTIAGKLGQPVLASAPGRVIFSGTGIRGLGKLVVIRHNANYLSVYAHNNALLVKEGQNVGKGQKIAEMGNSDADQVKLHFEIRRQGKPVDPIKLLPQQ